MTRDSEISNNPPAFSDTVSPTSALAMTKAELLELFRSSAAGEIPEGRTIGTALIAPGGFLGQCIATTTRLLFWKGKDFDSPQNGLLNRLSPVSIHAFRARVAVSASQLDQRPCIVLDYSATSFFAQWIRDEIRQVGPQDYLGLVFIKNHLVPVQFWLHQP